MPECTLACPQTSLPSAAKFAFVQITQIGIAPVNQMYGDFTTWTHTKVAKVEFSFNKAMRTKKCGNNPSVDSIVALQNLGGKFDIKPSTSAPPATTLNATVSGITGTVTFTNPGANLWETNTNITRLIMKPNFATLPPLQAGCAEKITIPVKFKVTYINSCTAQAWYNKQIIVTRQ